MTRARWRFAFLTLGLTGVGLAQEPAGLELRALDAGGEFEIDETTGLATGPAGVQASWGDAVLTARTLRFNRDTGEVAAEGGVRLTRGTEVWNGEQLGYNFATREIRTSNFRVGMPPFFAAGEGIQGNPTNQVHTATRAYVTSDDFAQPAYRIRARELRFVPGKYIEARGATAYLGGVPVLYLPRYRYHFDRVPNRIQVTPGYRSKYGPFLRGTYDWSLSTNLESTVRLDLRERRGVGGGLDFRGDFGRWGTNDLQTYYTHDQRPGEDLSGAPIDADRWRVSYSHAAWLRTNLTFKGVVRAQSDALITHDFFEREYRRDPQPKSFAEVDHYWPNFSLNLLAQPQVNDFFQTVERLPDVKLTATRQQLGISPFYYEGESSLAYLRHQFANDVQPSYAAARADTFHQLLLPQTFFGWLQVTPRAGGRFTWYGEEEGRDSTRGEQQRWVFNTGAEVSTKLARLWPAVESRWLDLRGLRHIVEPSVNYVFVPDPDVAPRELPQFDYELHSFRLLPVDFPDYNSIDSIDAQNVLRFGLRNRLQTKRQGRVEDVLHWSALLDWRLDPRRDQRTYGDFYSELAFKPRSWITLDSELRYDINETTLRMANHAVTLEPNDVWSWRVGHRYLLEYADEGPESGNNLIFSSAHVKLNEDWALGLAHHFEARDGTLEEQYYMLYRDFRSWTGALTFRLRDERDGRTDFTVALLISLKAFPRYGLNTDRDYHRTPLD